MSSVQHRLARPRPSRRWQARQRLAVGARQRSAPSPRSRRTAPPCGVTSGRAQAAVEQLAPGSRRCRRCRAFQAVMRSLASAPTTSSVSPPTACCPPTLRVQSSVPLSASRAGRPPTGRRARTACRRRAAPGPTRSARRSTSLVPRGLASATSQRTLPRSGSSPTSRGPCPTSRVSLYGGQQRRAATASAHRRAAAGATAAGRRARRRP